MRSLQAIKQAANGNQITLRHWSKDHRALCQRFADQR